MNIFETDRDMSLITSSLRKGLDGTAPDCDLARRIILLILELTTLDRNQNGTEEFLKRIEVAKGIFLTKEDHQIRLIRRSLYGMMPYDEYLRTDHWKVVRQKCWERFNRKCAVCNANGDNTKLDVHHRTYENLSQEEDADTVLLCRECHSLFHDNKKKPSKH